MCNMCQSGWVQSGLCLPSRVRVQLSNNDRVQLSNNRRVRVLHLRHFSCLHGFGSHFQIKYGSRSVPCSIFTVSSVSGTNIWTREDLYSRSFRFTASCWCFFSSVHPTHFLQGSGQKTGMAIAETWFCAQWPIFVLLLRFLFGLLYGWKIQTWPIIKFLTVSQLLIFFICWYLIESMMSCV